METNKQTTKEIDLVGLGMRVLREWRLLAKFIAIFAIIGIVKALATPKYYTSNVVLAPEMSSVSSMSESLSDIASMVGLNLGGGGASMDAIYPDIYPDIFNSTDFIITLFDVKITKKNDSKEQSYYNYLATDQKIPFWSYPMIWVKKLFAEKDTTNGKHGVNRFDLTRQQANICKEIISNIGCVVDKKTNVITLSFTDQDPKVAAIMADTIQHRLQQYITDYHTKKARIDLAYIEGLHNEARKQYDADRNKYVNYSEGHSNPSMKATVTQMDELENEMQLSFNAYSQLSQQLRLAKSKVQEKTPAFTIIQGATIPQRASSTPRSVMVILFIFLGVMFDTLWILWGRKAYNSWKSNK